MRYGVPASPPGAPLRLHGESIEDAPVGDPCRIGSTPASSVMVVTSVLLPSVPTSITASPFCKSEIFAAGMRLIICCKSIAPPPRRSRPPPPALAAPPPWPALPPPPAGWLVRPRRRILGSRRGGRRW